MKNNLLIFKIDIRQIIRFEPHGNATQGSPEHKENIVFDDFCKKFVKNINKELELNSVGKRPFKYVPPMEICPKMPNDLSKYKKGFQSMENMIQSKDGFCQLWSMFFMECVLRNPDMSVKEIYSKAYDKMNRNPEFFLAVIKGYFIQVNELKSALK